MGGQACSARLIIRFVWFSICLILFLSSQMCKTTRETVTLSRGGWRTKKRSCRPLLSHYKSDLPTLRRCCCHLINLNHLNYSPIILSLKRCRTRKYYVAINVLCKYSESRKDLLESISLIPSWTFPLWGAAPIKVLQLSPPLYILKGCTDCMSLSGI